MSHHSYLLIFIKIVATLTLICSSVYLVAQLTARYNYYNRKNAWSLTDTDRLVHARYGLVPVYRIWQPIVIILICIGVLLYQL